MSAERFVFQRFPEVASIATEDPRIVRIPLARWGFAETDYPSTRAYMVQTDLVPNYPKALRAANFTIAYAYEEGHPNGFRANVFRPIPEEYLAATLYYDPRKRRESEVGPDERDRVTALDQSGCWEVNDDLTWVSYDYPGGIDRLVLHKVAMAFGLPLVSQAQGLFQQYKP